MLARPEERAHGAYPDRGPCERAGLRLFIVERLLSNVAFNGPAAAGEAPVSFHSLVWWLRLGGRRSAGDTEAQQPNAKRTSSRQGRAGRSTSATKLLVVSCSVVMLVIVL